MRFEKRSCDDSRAAKAGGIQVKNISRDPSEERDARSIRALFQERPRKFKRHHPAQCKEPGTGGGVKKYETSESVNVTKKRSEEVSFCLFTVFPK